MLNIDLLHPIKVITTRWNTHAYCLMRILELEPVIKDVCTDKALKLKSYTFTTGEWSIEATKRVQRKEVALIHDVIPLIDTFTKILAQIIDSSKYHVAIRHAANMALAVLNKYYSYTDDSEVYRIAMRKSDFNFFFTFICAGNNLF